MRCSICHAPYLADRGLIVHVDGCAGALTDSEVFGIGVIHVEGKD